MSAANAVLLTPVLDPGGAWAGVWLHGDGELDVFSRHIRESLPGVRIYLTGDDGLATGIQSSEQFATAKATGATAFSGRLIAHPPVQVAGKQDAGRVVLLHLLALVTQDADTAEIEQVFKREPGLSFHLFRLVNSPGMGLTSKITTFNQAIMVLGRRQLQRWVQLLLYASKSEESNSPLLIFAAMRGHLLEQFVAARGGDVLLREQAFMTGIFSLLDSLLGMPMADIVASIRLEDTIQNALLDRQGPLGELLAWIDGVQAGEALPFPVENPAEQCENLQIGALAWALDVHTGVA